jgi:hypothetical protein
MPLDEYPVNMSENEIRQHLILQRGGEGMNLIFPAPIGIGDKESDGK